MKHNQKNIKKTKSGRYLDKILKAAVAALIITGIILFVAASVQDNMTMMYVGIAMLPAAGILITPNIVLYALKDNKGWKSKFRETRDRLYKEGLLSPPGDMTPYCNKLLWGVRREALWNLFKLMIVLAVLLAANYFLLIDGNSDNEMLSFIMLLGIITLGIPISSYNITCSVHRINIVKRREYTAYRTVASGADGIHMWIIDQKDIVHKFDYCRRLGIRAKDVHKTKVILVFVPDEVYLLPDIEQA